MMNRPEHDNAGDYAGTIHAIAEAAADGELDSEKLGELLSSRHGAVNCYPGEPTDTCYAMAWFVALEGQMGRGIQQDFGPLWHHRYHYWRRLSPWDDWGMPQPPYGFAAILERFVRHMQGHCAGTTREAIIVTDSWSAPDFERWRGNLERTRAQARVEIHLLGAGGWQQRLF